MDGRRLSRDRFILDSQVGKEEHREKEELKKLAMKAACVLFCF